MNMIYSQLLKKLKVEHGFSTIMYQISDRITFPKQNHTNNVVLVDELDRQKADAIVSTKKSQKIGVKTADCIPILMYEKDKHLIAAVHAGWKGTVEGIVKNAIEKLVSLGGSSKEIVAAFGPSIEFDCYDIPEDRAELIMKKIGSDNKFIKKMKGKYYFSLANVNYDQLCRSGIPKKQIEMNKWCTFCTDWLYSRRRDKVTNKGQNISFIELN